MSSSIDSKRQALQAAGDDLGMMQDPSLWPVYPVLPLKRAKNSGLETGVLVAVDEAESVYAWIPGATMFETLRAWDTRIVEVTTPAGLQAILDDGWKVD